MMKKIIINTLFIAAVLVFLIGSVCSLEPVHIEFLYLDRFCQYCPDAVEDYMAYVHNREVVMNIERDYGENVTVEWIPFFSEDGLKKVKEYNLTLRDWNSIVVNHEIVLFGGKKFVNETDLREIIDLQLADINQPKPTTPYKTIGAMATAFVLGFFESFSPCVLIMLSFIVGYTLSDKNQFQLREGFLKVMVFGVGFIFAAAVLGWACGLLFSSMPNLQLYLTLIVCFLAIIFGLNLLGLFKFPEKSKSLIRELAKKYVFGYVGIFILGLVFYFLDPCIAPIFASMTAILFSGVFTLALLFFCIGAMVPFIGAGLLVGSISRITRNVYKNRFVLRKISGAILIGYALYILSMLLLFEMQ